LEQNFVSLKLFELPAEGLEQTDFLCKP
jgi:hypothetical protein